MRVTFILKNLTEKAYEEIGAMADSERYTFLTKWAFGDMRHCVSVKYGTSNAFRDRVEANGILRGGNAKFQYKIEPRKGYKLATFEISK